jgi:integrase/recombinase XerD
MTLNKDLFEAQTPNKDIVEQFEIQRWLKGKNRGTKDVYLGAIRAYIEYTGLSPKQLIDQAEEDRKKSARERGDPEFKVSSFFEYLVNDYMQKGKGRKDRKPNGKIGLSRNLASAYANAVRGFYKQNGFPLIVSIPKAVPKKENFKLILRIPEIKRLVDATGNLRDRAIVLSIFQSGASIGEICDLKYEDVAYGLQTNEEPLHLHLIRKKEQTEYHTFLGTDAINAIKAYLAQRQRNKEILTDDSPLFILQHTTKCEGTRIKKIYPSLVEASLTKAAVKAGLVSEEKLRASDMSPCRPHAIRTAFISILKMAGMNNLIVEELCGHTLPGSQQPYWLCNIDELRKTYKEFEKYLSINGVADNQKLEELENKTKNFEQETKKNQNIIDELMENSKFKSAQINGLNSQINDTAGQLSNVTNLLAQVQENLTKLNNEMNLLKLQRE